MSNFTAEFFFIGKNCHDLDALNDYDDDVNYDDFKSFEVHFILVRTASLRFAQKLRTIQGQLKN